MKCFSLISLLLISCNLVVGLDILVCVTWVAKSHFFAFSRLFEALSAKGHNVTVISHYPQYGAPPTYRNIDIGKVDVLFSKIESIEQSQKYSYNEMTKFAVPMIMAEKGRLVCDETLNSKNLQEFFRETRKFHLVLLEDFFADCLRPLGQMYGCPTIKLVSHILAPWNTRNLANPLGSAYLPNINLKFSNKMKFFERLENSVVNMFVYFHYNSYVIATQKEIATKYLPVDEKAFDTRNYLESLILVNAHFSLTSPGPLVPNIIEVGGIHLGEPQKLSQELEKWITEAKHGVIYFSLGSVIKGQTMPEDKKNAFINAFKRLPQRVIWKWENDTMEGKTNNILIGKWLPQFDILSHPNVKAFISHGGLLGTMEAVHSGTPMVVMPQFGDQHTNAQSMAKAGGGVVLYMSEATEETIYQALKNVLGPKFQSQMKELSERFRDRPMSPLDTAIYWVEYVARHKGAHFMKTAAVGMPFYQYYLLDVIAFIVFILSIASYITYITLRYVLRKIFGSSIAKQKTKQKRS